MRILFLAPANSTHTVKWVNALAERGNEIYLVYNSGHEPELNSIDSSVNTHKLKYSGTKAYYMNGRELRKYWKTIKPDIVNAHYASGYGTLVRMSRISPVILSVWGSDVYAFPNESRLKKRILCKNLLHADEVLSTSECMKRQVYRVCKKVKHVDVIPFGVDIEKFKRKSDIKQNKDSIVIGCVKALEPIYGMEYLIKAISLLKKKIKFWEMEERRKNIQCIIYGEGSSRKLLEDLIRQERLEEVVELRGRIPHGEVPEKLNGMDIFCVMSIEESFGVAVVEAQATGLPVVVSDAEGFCEVVEDGKTGFVVRRKSALEAAEALERLVRDECMRKALGEAGRARVELLYDWNKNVELLIEKYKDIVRKV